MYPLEVLLESAIVSSLVDSEAIFPIKRIIDEGAYIKLHTLFNRV